MTRYYEDLAVGWTETYGSHRMTEDGIVAFAEQFDPQPMHVDPDAAAETVHGGLIASGLHTVGVATRLMVEGFLDRAANLGGLGIDDLRFHEAVRPGDVLSARHEVTAKRPSESNPGAGIVVREIEVVRDDRDGDAGDDPGTGSGTVVCSWEVTILVARR